MKTTTTVRLTLLTLGLLLAMGATTLLPAAAFPVAAPTLKTAPGPIAVEAAFSASADGADEPSVFGEGGLVGLPAALLLWWGRRMMMRGVRRLIWRGVATSFGHESVRPAGRPAPPSAPRASLFGGGSKILNERIERVMSAYATEPDYAPAAAHAPPAPPSAERAFGRRGLR